MDAKLASSTRATWHSRKVSGKLFYGVIMLFTLALMSSTYRLYTAVLRAFAALHLLSLH